MTVSELKAERKRKKSSFNSYAKRRDAVRNIIERIDSKLDDNVRDVNSQIQKCADELRSGLKGVSGISTVCANIEDNRQNVSDLDSKISSCRSNMSSEAVRCQGEINALDDQIRRIEGQIREQGGTIYFWE